MKNIEFENAIITTNKIMLELQHWINITYEAEFEIRETDYFRWHSYSNELNRFNFPEIKQFKNKFDNLINSMHSKKVFLFGTIYTCPTFIVKQTYEELANINVNFMLKGQ